MAALDRVLAVDAEVFAALNSADLGRVGDAALSGSTWLGTAWVAVPLLVLAAAGPYRQRRRQLLLTAIVALCLGGALTQLVKWGVDRPRPALVAGAPACGPPTALARTPATSVVVRAEPLCRRSFPSGHTQTAFTWCFVLALFSRRHTWALALAVGILVGWSRIHLGVHYPLDVVAGALLGLASAWVAFRCCGARDERGAASPSQMGLNGP